MNIDSIKRERIQELLDGEDMILYDGCDDAIIGVGSVHSKPLIAVYCYNKLVDVFVKQEDMTYEEAMEYIDFNIVGAYVGETTPLIMHICYCGCELEIDD